MRGWGGDRLLLRFCVLAVICAVTVDVARCQDTLAARHALGKNLGLLANGEPLCRNGAWTEHSVASINDLRQNPDVQCWRDPPCLRMNSYITPQVCAQWPRDDDWPTWDPHHAVPAGAKTFADAVRSRLVNKTVVFIGDSVGAQVFIAALCEAARGGLAPVETTVKLTLSASEAPLPEHITRRLAAIRKVTTDTPVEAWIGGPPRLPWLVEETGTLLVSKGWHKWGRADMTPLLGFADVILVNYGLHYLVELQGGGVTTEYDEALREFFAQVAEFAATPGKAVLFRETGVEHANVFAKNGQGCSCEQVPSGEGKVNAAMHRNAVLKRVLQDFPQIQLVPFYDLSHPVVDLHEGAWCSWDYLRFLFERWDANPGERATWRPEPICCDCTHYCYTPQFWGTFYADFYLALERAPGFRNRV